MSSVNSAGKQAARSPVGRRLGPAYCAHRLLICCLSLALLGLGLSACKPEPLVEPAPASSAAPAADTDRAPATGASDASVMKELARIERGGLVKPVESERDLLALQARVKPGSAELLELLILRSNLAINRRDTASAESHMKLMREWPNPRLAAEAKLAQHVLRARLLAQSGQLELAKKELSDLNSYTAGPTSALRRAYSLLGALQSDTGNADAALLNLHQALKLAEKTGEAWRRVDLLGSLANTYVEAQQLERAEQTINEALREAERDPDTYMLLNVQTMRGIIYAELGKHALAQRAKQEALAHARRSGVEDLLSLALANYADYHLKQGNYTEALRLAEEALPLAMKTQDLSSQAVALANMGLAKIALKRVEEGKRDALAGIAIDAKRGANSGASIGWQELGAYLEKAGDLPGAADAYHRYRKLIDQSLRADTRKAVLEAQARYDDERRAQELELLNRDMNLKAEQLRERDLRLKLWAALGGCVLLSGVLLGLAYQRIRKTNLALASSNAALRVQGERDPLTGLSNRRHFQAAIKRLADQGRLSGTVFLIDIDHFKRINDGYGHAAGDSVLIEIAKRLRSTLRDEDLVVRWGGEEFLIVVDTRDAAYAGTLAQRLLDHIGSEPVSHGGQSIPITASIGFASFPIAPQGLALSWERAIDLVDTVMYMAKAHGRNKAYGIQSIAAEDEANLLLLAAHMEAAWHEGSVQLLALQGPEPVSPPT
ncbi:diguanylate cyclase [Paucibacter sp. TC2R-5]|uniref:diguanylate cyclase n=1 Tax=Paucibacter sp. TC2R-5 TaxID=2893555 RepID=UPI0021E408FD|nr:diguanylate cyclase [Paucibacter sp. TC2R-5]MCV2360772.1 diguanylate cyclase [Paucibacter sp. TC2R-5]